MYLPKKDIFKTLSDNLKYEISQGSQAVFNVLPTVTFEVLENSTSLLLDNDIGYQKIVIKLDIWADTSEEASRILSEVEAIMRTKLRYRLEFSADVPNLDKSIWHISCRFSK